VLKLLGIAVVAAALWAIYALLRDREEHPRAHGLCPGCGSRYVTRDDESWRCRMCGETWGGRDE